MRPDLWDLIARRLTVAMDCLARHGQVTPRVSKPATWQTQVFEHTRGNQMPLHLFVAAGKEAEIVRFSYMSNGVEFARHQARRKSCWMPRTSRYRMKPIDNQCHRSSIFQNCGRCDDRMTSGQQWRPVDSFGQSGEVGMDRAATNDTHFTENMRSKSHTCIMCSCKNATRTIAGLLILCQSSGMD